MLRFCGFNLVDNLLNSPIFEPQFWLDLVVQYKDIGAFAPIFLAMMESFIPALPLVLIIAFNASAHGFFLGFIYSYLGNLFGSILVFMLFRMLERSKLIGHFIHGKRLSKILHWVVSQPPSFLTVISAIPFTPSSFVNIAFGLSGYSKRRFVVSIAIGKFLMVLLLTVFGNTLIKITENPVYIVVSILILGIAYYLSHRYGKLNGLDDL